jgi:hypothetical protein
VRTDSRAAHRRARAFAWLGLTAVLLTPAASALAASPSAPPSPSPTPQPFPGIEAWLDAPLRSDARPGSRIEVGITFWDTAAHTFAQVGGVYILLRPAEGDAEPAVGGAVGDFRGHIVAEFVVPEGGPGVVEVGVQGRFCTDDGTCTDENLPYTIVGSGPPPEADPATLIDAAFQPLVGDIVAGREFPITADVFPRGLWDAGAITFPDLLFATATLRGVEIATADLRRSGPPGSPYAGRLSIPEPGAMALAVVVPDAGGEPQAIATSTLAVTVIEAGAGAGEEPNPADPGTADADGEIPLTVWLVGIGVLVVVGFGARRLLADL